MAPLSQKLEPPANPGRFKAVVKWYSLSPGSKNYSDLLRLTEPHHAIQA
jgi:hypothetical protein